MLFANVFSLLKVDLTAYVEKHEFCFDAVLDEHVSNDEVLLFLLSVQAAVLDYSVAPSTM